MYGVDGGGTYELQSFVEGQSLILHVVQQALCVHEGSVPLIHMIDLLLDA